MYVLTEAIDSANKTNFGCYDKITRNTDLKVNPKRYFNIFKSRMATYSLLIGILVIIIAGKIYKDWASGIAGFIYGGFVIWTIHLCIQLLKALVR